MRTMLQGRFSGALIDQLDRLFRNGTTAGLTEGELLERFVAANDEAAFEVLLARHGPTVLGVCRRILRDPNDVDDAFQATFLVLVRKAGSLRQRDLLGNWLYGVAHKVATRSRVLAAKRTARAPFGQDAIDGLDAGTNSSIAVRDEPEEPATEPSPWVHEEVRLLPEKYRTLVLLCYFEGLTHEQAAARLGCPIGTVKGRLARAREILRKRLVRRGITATSAAITAELAESSLRAAVPESLRIATIQTIRAAGSSVASMSVVVPVVTLAEGVLQTMITSRLLKSAAIGLFFVSAATAGRVVSSAQSVGPKASPEASARAKAAAEAAGSRGTARPAPTPENPSSPLAWGGAPAAKPAEEPFADAARPRKVGPPRAGVPFEDVGGGASWDPAHEFQTRLQIAQLAAALEAVDKTPQNQAVLKALDEPIAMAFPKPTPLDDVIKYLRKATTGRPGMKPVPIYVDPQGLSEVNATETSKVTIDLEGIPLRTSLRLLLKQLRLAYCVRDGVLIISSVDGIHAELAEEAREQMGSGNVHFDQQTLNQMGLMGGGMGMM